MHRYIVKNDVEKREETLEMLCDKEIGTTFNIKLYKLETMITELNPKFETVMIIDDNSIDLYVCLRIITKNNFGKKVLEFSVATKALQYLQDHQNNFSILPQIIFLDIYMPEMSGFEFMKEYDKLSPQLKNHCKVYMISSTIDTEDIVKSQTDKNVVSFHVKPITKEFLNRIIAE